MLSLKFKKAIALFYLRLLLVLVIGFPLWLFYMTISEAVKASKIIYKDTVEIWFVILPKAVREVRAEKRGKYEQD